MSQLLSEFSQSKRAFWRLVDAARERGYVNADDMAKWGEWEESAYDLAATAVFYPVEITESKKLLEAALLNKGLTANEFLRNISQLINDIWKDKDAKFFLTPPTES